jgi:hypothetical protein
LLRLALYAAAATAVVLLVRAFDSRRLPDLDAWHRVRLAAEFQAEDADDVASLEAYLAREARVFEELSERVERDVPDREGGRFNRFSPASASHPDRFDRNWNRSVEVTPPRIRGGALLLHGLTDSPYSLRSVSRLLVEMGFTTLAPRMPGHGTHPRGLIDARYEDWQAVARLGARHVREKVGDDAPFVVVGRLRPRGPRDAGASGSGPPRPDLAGHRCERRRGPRELAQGAELSSLVREVPLAGGAARVRPLQVQLVPEERGSADVPAHAGRGGRSGTGPRRRLARGLPAHPGVPVRAVLDPLYSTLGSPRHALVLFDVNRKAQMHGFLGPNSHALAAELEATDGIPYRLTLLTNANPDSLAVAARELGSRDGIAAEVDTGLAWPWEVYSLSHVALPFPPDDPLYGMGPIEDGFEGIRIGTVTPRGERDLLTISISQVMRLRYNPFYPYLAARIREWLSPDAAFGAR